MKKTLFFIFFINFSISFAEIPDFLLRDEFQTCKQDLNICSHSKSYENQFSEKFSSSSLDSNLNVLNYDLFLDWTTIFSGDEYALENTIYSGIQNITFEKLVPGNSIKLNAVNLFIDSISFMGNNISNFTLQEGILEIKFGQTIKEFSKYEISIYFRNNGVVDRGFYLYPKGKIIYRENEYNNYEKLAATFSQPEMARNWMPCNDVPNDKAFAKISVKVPEGYEVASNGLLNDKVEESVGTNSFTTFVWEDKNHPISTYLMAVSASKFAVLTDQYKKEISGEIIPILNYVWREDSLGNFANGDTHDAINSLKITPTIIKTFSDMFVEYNFDKYGHVSVQPFDFGGMEHQTITSINRSWLRGNAEIGIAHEIAHHWIGDLITCESWQDIWINEGGATWFEALWVYAKNKDKGEATAFELYNKYHTERSWRYLSDNRLYDKVLNITPTDLIFNYYNLSYTKASWVYHMLFRRLGQDFLDFMGILFTKYRHNNLSSGEFEQELSDFVELKNINFDVNEYFNQIVYTSGHPSYYIFMDIDKSNGGLADYKLKIQQAQGGNGFNDVYKYHIKVDCYSKGKLDTSFIVFNNQRVQDYDITLNRKIDSVNIDKSYTLCNVWTNIVSVKESDMPIDELKVNPNPVNFGQEIKIEIPILGKDLEIEIFDILGNLIFREYLHNNNSSILYTIDSKNFNSGTFNLVIKSNQKVLNKKFIVLKN